MIEFNIPFITGKEQENLTQLFSTNKYCGDGFFTKKVTSYLENLLGSKSLITTSCTHALEMAALLINVQPGDEIIMPSYTFVSSANPFILRGAKIVFIDIDPQTMNINVNKIEEAITNKTVAILPVHYAGISCDMLKIKNIADKYNLFIIEDAAQALNSKYNTQLLGTLGDIGCISFHETKNIHCGEGGAIILNSEMFNLRSEIIREKGTNRSLFLRGQVDKYTWKDIGSSYLPSELNAAFLVSQLEFLEQITNYRGKLWNSYYEQLKDLEFIELPHVPNYAIQNYHMFYIKVRDLYERTSLINYLKKKNINTSFHYVPLHTSDAGLKYSRFHGEDVYTTIESERLLRLPMHHVLTISDVNYVCDSIKSFYLK